MKICDILVNVLVVIVLMVLLGISFLVVWKINCIFIGSFGIEVNVNVVFSRIVVCVLWL